ncbi:MAG: integral membrane sensor signal transduction histidine kinase [Nocardioidaceae bacterium]|nr:integral membrane sensor signal transduction histidine kinase [Nocardioidaceae bacterium]NUS49578.1 integral membrane sensor signal transduction histidine kinase [Nocardioidaceae bacterium]
MTDTRLPSSVGTPTHASEPYQPPWVVLADPSRDRGRDDVTIDRRRVLATMLLGALAVIVLVGASGTVAARRLAERESVNDAAKTTALLADTVVQPALRDDLLTGNKAAFDQIDKAVRDQVLGPYGVRVKLWTADGRIVYSDEPRLVGEKYRLGAEEREVFSSPVSRAEISDLDRPENKFELGQGKLLEVYRPVWTPNGTPLLFEVYSPYDGVTERTGQLWRGFAGITLSSLLGLIVLMLPVVWTLLGSLRAAQKQREGLLERAVEASADERRRIAGTLHDGVVQELAGASFSVASAAARARSVGQPELAEQLRDSSGVVRRSIASMRSLLVDIYPPSLAVSGLVVALEDLGTGLRSREVDVHTDVDPDAAAALGEEQQRLVYRVAQECLLNCMRHAMASTARLSLSRERDTVLLVVEDDGQGFDAAATWAHPPEDHFGMRVLADIAREGRADLRVAAAPGWGTRWEMRLRPEADPHPKSAG